MKNGPFAHNVWRFAKKTNADGTNFAIIHDTIWMRIKYQRSSTTDGQNPITYLLLLYIYIYPLTLPMWLSSTTLKGYPQLEAEVMLAKPSALSRIEATNSVD